MIIPVNEWKIASQSHQLKFKVLISHPNVIQEGLAKSKGETMSFHSHTLPKRIYVPKIILYEHLHTPWYLLSLLKENEQWTSAWIGKQVSNCKTHTIKVGFLVKSLIVKRCDSFFIALLLDVVQDWFGEQSKPNVWDSRKFVLNIHQFPT